MNPYRNKRGFANDPDPVKTFWSRVDKSGSCWIWKGARTGPHREYGQFAIKGRGKRAHRLVWEWLHGPIPEGLHVCHRCDNGLCVNPDHLFLGIAKDNQRDSLNKGRHQSLKQKGEKGPNAKLTQSQADQIRWLYQQGNISQAELSNNFGVDQAAISRIIHNKSYIQEQKL